MKKTPISLMVCTSGIACMVVAVLLTCFRPIVSFAAAPSDEERRRIEMMIGAYYLAVAAEDVDELVDLHHWQNSFERDKVKALVEQAFSVGDSEFERVRVQAIDLYPERNIGLVRVGVDYLVRSYDGTDAFSGHLDAAFVLVRGSRGWLIGKVGRAADLDLTAAVSGLAAKSQELEKTVAEAPVGVVDPPSTSAKRPKLATSQALVTQAPSSGTGTAISSAASASTNGGLTFFALRRKITGECAVVAGAEGIEPGDTVYGAYPDYAAAHDTLSSRCGADSAQSVPVVSSPAGGPPLTSSRLYSPDDTVTRGRWGTVVAIAGNSDFAAANEGGRPINVGLYAPPGNGGPTEAVYRHDGSPVTFRGTATVIDCIDYCGAAGSVTFSIVGNGREIWNSGKVLHRETGRVFAVDLDGVTELRLITTDGGNGTGEDWAAWLDLEVGEDAPQQAAPVTVSVPKTRVDGPAILAVPRYRADESTAGAFVIDLSDGSADFIDRVGIDGNTYRKRTLNLNVFTVLGRLNDMPAKPGEILAGEIRSTSGAVTGIFLVETSTGAAAYLAGLENEPNRATFRPVDGRPAAAIASDDGNFALVMRRDGSGGTDGAYLYHATSGQCVYFAHVDEMRPDPVVKFTTSLPKMIGRVTALALQNGGEATPQGLLVDDGTGEIYKVGGLDRDPVEMTVNRQPLVLFDFFPQTPPMDVSPRFILVPGYSDSGAADMVFVVDAGSGRMAVLKNVRMGSGMRLVGSTKSLATYLPERGAKSRAMAAVPKVGASGTTDGAWVFDSAMDGLLFLEHVRGPQNLKIYRIEKNSNGG